LAQLMRAAALAPLVRLAVARQAPESTDPVGGRGLPDVSNDICWQGDWTRDRCCKGDATTHPDCWDGVYSFGECCPNADCWADNSFTYEKCCSEDLGPAGNPGCWSTVFTYEHCCLARPNSQSWIDVMVGGVDTGEFYAMDEFYTDAQYGDDFGYYSTGRVLRAKAGKVDDTQQFAHFTTYPMALSPHFARVFCRLLFVMWIQLEERAPFRVVEMGAGSGQLAADIQQCVKGNELGISPPIWRRWASAFEYVIMERSPALAQRQRERGLRVVAGDAQRTDSCPPVLAALAASAACSGGAVKGAPECVASEHGTAEAGASVVLSNELLDAFAPVKLRLSLYGEINVTSCASWQEVRLVHAIPKDELRLIVTALGHSDAEIESMFRTLERYTEEVFCGMAASSIGQEARERVPKDTSCLALALGLSELLHHVDLGVPSAPHNMRLRIRKDQKLWSRLREVVELIEQELHDSAVLPRNVYRQLRHQLRNAPDLEVRFLTVTNTRHMPVTISEQRCGELSWWFVAHEQRTMRLVEFYQSLGYPAVHLVVRPGEDRFIDLVDCLLGPTGGFKLSVDYGASFEALGHSLSIDPRNDGIFVPPIPMELMQDLPHCHAFWPKCAGRIDWTTFVDFTNLAAAGERRGWRTLFYGPQSALEHISNFNLSMVGRDGARRSYPVPGYSVLAGSWSSRHVSSWYGRETLASDKETGSWVQRWTSFKALVLEKPSAREAPRPVLFPSWHLDTREADPCWRLDPTTVPLSDWIPRQGKEDARKALETLTEEINDNLGREYQYAYEEAQLAVRMVDWLVATGGCESLRRPRASSLLGSEGLWKSLLARLRRVWGEMWGEEDVARVALGIVERLAAEPDELDAHASPPACAGQQTYVALCGG